MIMRSTTSGAGCQRDVGGLEGIPSAAYSKAAEESPPSCPSTVAMQAPVASRQANLDTGNGQVRKGAHGQSQR